jgi:hypothetical protein
MRNEAEGRIGSLYPKVTVTPALISVCPHLKPYSGQQLTIIAWIWARTVASSSPAYQGVHVPLVNSYWLGRKKGNRIPPGIPQKKQDGTVVRTLWGELAWQLGGKQGYAIVKEADENASNPGDRLRELFKKFSPCLILIDEWVAYARQLHEGSNLPAGTFDTHFSFAQALTETVKASPQALLVVSIPSSDIEVGGEWGRQALIRLKNITSRLQPARREHEPERRKERCD